MPGMNSPSLALTDCVTGHSETGQEILVWVNDYGHFRSDPFKWTHLVGGACAPLPRAMDSVYQRDSFKRFRLKRQGRHQLFYA